ncbi:IS4 family transposase [Echinicola marina]|nr:IS4 family transposase [Echinicola marina]
MLAEKINFVFDPGNIHSLARKSGFLVRKSKLDGFQFLFSLVFAYHRGDHFSLLDMVSYLFKDFGIKITKQSLHDRFSSKAVGFLKSCLDNLLSQRIQYPGNINILKSHFNRIRIKDSTKFALPDSFSEKYKGYRGALHNSSSMISIQYEYDFLSGQSMDLRLTNGVRNDQSDSRESTHDIQERDLFLRDLGYCTLNFLSMVNSAKAYFVCRLAPKTNIYPCTTSKDPIDVKDYLKKLKKHQLHHMEVEVFLGKKERIPARAVISLADTATYEKRLRKTSKQARSTGNRVSTAFKIRAQLNIMVTNVPRRFLGAENIRTVYSLRWQIELLFKVWKSQATINEFTTGKIERFECQLYGKLIWIILNMNIFNWLQQRIYKHKKVLCSVWKYFKHIKNLSDQLMEAIKVPRKIINFMEKLAEIAPKILLLERKKGKLSLNQAVNSLA